MNHKVKPGQELRLDVVGEYRLIQYLPLGKQCQYIIPYTLERTRLAEASSSFDRW